MFKLMVGKLRLASLEVFFFVFQLDCVSIFCVVFAVSLIFIAINKKDEEKDFLSLRF